MSSPQQQDGPQEPWRDRLARRLAQFMAVVTPGALVPVAMGTDNAAARAALIVAVVLLWSIAFLLTRRTTAPTARAIGVVVAFAGIGVAGYATVGFLSAPGVAFALSVATAGLLLGRRAMVVTALVVGAVVFVVGALMTRDILPAPPIEDISPRLARPWLRSSVMTMMLIVTLGAVVTWVVENVEAALQRADREALRRQKAERHVLQAQRRELMVQLAAGLAHDVNNQLTVISAWNSLRAAQGSRVEDRQRASDAIAAAVQNAAGLTKRLLVLGRADVRNPRAVDLSALVRTYETTLRGFLPGDIAVVVESDDAVWCLADEGQLHRVLLNLSLNARDAMPDGGTLTVRVTRRENASAESVQGPLDRGDWAVLEVADVGAGMDDETRQRAFDPFFTTKTVGKGTGLGLATIAAIAEQSEGGVVLDSALGQGTTVAVWLPTTRPALARDSAAPAAMGLGNARVLLTEDTDAVRAAAQKALADAGCTVVTAADGDEALARIGEESFDVLCSDVVMPGAPVVDVIEAMSRKNPNARVLLCSGYVGEDLVRRGIEEGRYHFLQKPYTVTALIERIAAVLGDDDGSPPPAAT